MQIFVITLITFTTINRQYYRTEKEVAYAYWNTYLNEAEQTKNTEIQNFFLNSKNLKYHVKEYGGN